MRKTAIFVIKTDLLFDIENIFADDATLLSELDTNITTWHRIKDRHPQTRRSVEKVVKNFFRLVRARNKGENLQDGVWDYILDDMYTKYESVFDGHRYDVFLDKVTDDGLADAIRVPHEEELIPSGARR